MEYFIIKNANDPAITGNVYPQISSYKGWCWANYQFLSQLRPNVLPQEDFVLDYLVLDKKAKTTNFLSDGILFLGFIIDGEVKKILDTLSLPTHKYFKAHVEVQNHILRNYYWIVIVSEMYEKHKFRKIFV